MPDPKSFLYGPPAAGGAPTGGAPTGGIRNSLKNLLNGNIKGIGSLGNAVALLMATWAIQMFGETVGLFDSGEVKKIKAQGELANKQVLADSLLLAMENEQAKADRRAAASASKTQQRMAADAFAREMDMAEMALALQALTQQPTSGPPPTPGLHPASLMGGSENPFVSTGLL